jgi:hypothetical protein
VGRLLQTNRHEGACECDHEQQRVSRGACLVEEHQLGLQVAIIVTLAARVVQVQARGQLLSLNYTL